MLRLRLAERGLTLGRLWIGITGELVSTMRIGRVRIWADVKVVVGDDESELMKMIAQLPKETNKD